MDKRRRTALRGTPPERVCELVLPVLQRKAGGAARPGAMTSGGEHEVELLAGKLV